MRRLFYILTILLFVSCEKNVSYDAQGTFEATEVIISSEATGRILNFDVAEGENLKANAVVGAIDSVQLHLQHPAVRVCCFGYSISMRYRFREQAVAAWLFR